MRACTYSHTSGNGAKVLQSDKRQHGNGIKTPVITDFRGGHGSDAGLVVAVRPASGGQQVGSNLERGSTVTGKHCLAIAKKNSIDEQT